MSRLTPPGQLRMFGKLCATPCIGGKLLLMRHVVFYLGLGTLFTHELDAMTSYEWRLIPILRSLPEALGLTAFVIIHIPLFAGIIALIASNNDQTRSLSRIAVSGFLLLHAVLHIWFSSNPNYGFVSAISNWIIFGGAGFGAIYLALSYNEYRSSKARW